MNDIPTRYPYESTKKEIYDIIHNLSEDIMPESHTNATSAGKTPQILKLGKIQLGLNELQSRSNRKLTIFTIIIALLSLSISTLAGYFAYSSFNSSTAWENKQHEQINSLDQTLNDNNKNMNKNIDGLSETLEEIYIELEESNSKQNK